MRIVSVNVSRPREVIWRRKRITTAIFKEPVEGPVALRTLNLDGDRQDDLSVHGGPQKAAYVYLVDHYEFWRRELPEMDLPWGMFGENLTAEWLAEDAVMIGDWFRVGSAEVMVTQPRLPCYKLCMRFGRKDIVKRFLASGRTGFYLAVVREGTVQSGDAVELIEHDTHGVTVADITRLYARYNIWRGLRGRPEPGPALPERWRDYLRNRLEKLAASGRVQQDQNVTSVDTGKFAQP